MLSACGTDAVDFALLLARPVSAIVERYRRELARHKGDRALDWGVMQITQRLEQKGPARSSSIPPRRAKTTCRWRSRAENMKP